MSKYNESTIKQIEVLYQQYYSITHIGKELRLNRKIVAHELQKLGYAIHTNSGYKSSTMDKYLLAKEEYLKGNEGIAKLSRKYCFDPCRFSLFLLEQGISVDGGRISKRLEIYQEELKKSEYMYVNKDIGVKAIAKLMKIPRHYVQYYLKRRGYDTQEDARKYKIDDTIFKQLNTEEHFYWFGYLLADGNVYVRGRYVLELVSKDKEHLEKFQKFLRTDIPITPKKVKLNNKTFTNYRILVHNKKIVTDLINLGLNPNKSLTLEFPSKKIVPEKFLNHFIRGYFDGDGHISPYQRYEKNKEQCFIIFIGTSNFLQKLPEAFNLTPNKLIQKGKAYSLRYGGNKKAFGIAKYLYFDAQIYLDRKYNEYLKWSNKLL